MRRLLAWFLSSSMAAMAGAPAAAATGEMPAWRTSTPEEQRLDLAAFEHVDQGMGATEWGDVQSLVVVLRGRTVYEYYRDGDRDALRNTQSVTKSALALLVGTAVKRGQLASLDQPVVELMPEWRPLNPDPRAASITLRHLLGMTTGFEVNDSGGTAGAPPPRGARGPRRGAAAGGGPAPGPGRCARNRARASPTTTAGLRWSRPSWSEPPAAPLPNWRANRS